MAQSSDSIDYKAVFRSLPKNFLLISPDGKILDDNDNHEVVSLKKRTEVIGKDFFDAYPATDQNQAEEIIKSHEHVRKFKEAHEMPLIRYDLERPAEQGGGLEVRYWQATHYPILNENGELLYILQNSEDVTSRYEAERQAKAIQEELDEAQSLSNFILESLPVMVWTTDKQGKATYFNQRWLNFTGKSLNELQGSGWSTIIHPDDAEKTRSRWEHSVKTGEEYQIEYRLRKSDGTYRWLLTRGIPRMGKNGEITLWVGSSTDIHDQKQLVQEIMEANEQQALLADQVQQAYQEVKIQRENFHTLFQQAPAAITILSGPEHRFTFVNPGYQALFPHRELLGKTVAEALPEVIDQGFIRILDNVYNTGETFYGNEVPIMLDRKGTGELVPTYFNFTYQRFHETGGLGGINVFAYDITELVAAKKQLELSEKGTS